MTVRKILVGHDFSDDANRALRYAAQLARVTGASLAIAYVRPEIYDGRGDPSLALPTAQPELADRYFHFLEEELRRIARQVLEADEPAVSCHVLRGDPVKRMAELADELGADLICVATTDKGPIQRVFLGSVSQLLLRASAVPVLLIP
jgi:nucleotide-binding universal stress UspA family protein